MGDVDWDLSGPERLGDGCRHYDASMVAECESQAVAVVGRLSEVTERGDNVRCRVASGGV